MYADSASGFVAATFRAAAPLLLAAAGELLVESTGLLNIGLEGMLAVGAVAAYFAAAHTGPAGGLVAGALAGLALSAVLAGSILRFRAEQVIAGTAVTMIGLGVSGASFRVLTSSAGPASVATFPEIRIPILSDVPIIGPAVFTQPVTTYLALAAVVAVSLVLRRTVFGLAMRAAGERPRALHALGHSLGRIRLIALCAGGVLGGIAGATLVVSQAGAFADGITAGRGFVALAIVALGRWRARGVFLGGLAFGAIGALQFLAQAMGWGIPYGLVLAAPYVATLVALSAIRGARVAPAALGRDSDPDHA